MKDLIEYIARSLVDQVDKVEVTQQKGPGGRIKFELRVAREDMGRVIGKGGKVANAMRILLRVAAVRQGKRVTLEIV